MTDKKGAGVKLDENDKNHCTHLSGDETFFESKFLLVLVFRNENSSNLPICFVNASPKKLVSPIMSERKNSPITKE